MKTRYLTIIAIALAVALFAAYCDLHRADHMLYLQAKGTR